MPLATFRHALVVGASSGIGAAVATQLAALGCRTALVARRADELRQTAAASDAAGGTPGGTLVYPHDVRDTAEIPDLFPRICRDLGGLDLIVYSAGVMPRIATSEFSFAKDEPVIAVNVLGAIAWLNEAAVRFAAAGSGTIVGLSSAAGDRGRRGYPVYCASKAALDTYLEALRNRLATRGVRVVTVKPGPIDTPMTRGLDRLPMLAPVDLAARQVITAARRGRRIAYVPRRWRAIMFVVRHIPAPIFERLDI
jgi:NAD(P)-dependent dehydrogenase (short-subunit alcohol dehydrogenase family)